MFLCGGLLNAQSHFGSGSINHGNALHICQDGAIVVVGKIRPQPEADVDLAIWRMNPCGELLSEDLYGGSRQDEALDIIGTRDGGYLVAGYSYTAEAGFGRHDIYLLKFDPQHTLEWERRIGRPFREIPFAVRELENGYLLTGYTKSQGLHGDVYLARISRAGQLVWDQFYQADYVDFGFDVQVEDHSYLILATTAGFYFPSQANHHYPEANLMLIRTDTLGNELSRKYWGGPRHDFGRRLLPDGHSGYYVFGSSQSKSAGSFDLALSHFNAELDPLWTRNFGGPDFDMGMQCLPMQNGDLLLVGASRGKDGDVDLLIQRVDSSGNSRPSFRIEGPAHEYPQDAQLRGETLVITGASRFGTGEKALLYFIDLKGAFHFPCNSPPLYSP